MLDGHEQVWSRHPSQKVLIEHISSQDFHGSDIESDGNTFLNRAQDLRTSFWYASGCLGGEQDLEFDVFWFAFACLSNLLLVLADLLPRAPSVETYRGRFSNDSPLSSRFDRCQCFIVSRRKDGW